MPSTKLLATLTCRYPLFLFLTLLLSCGTDDLPADRPTTPNTADPGIARLNAAIGAQPDAADLYVQRAEMLAAGGDLDAAVQDLERAVALDSTNIAYYYLLSDVYLEYYRSRLALRTLEKAATLDPDNLETQLRLSEVRLILKQYDDAIASLNQAVRLDPRHPEAYYLLAQVFAETGDTVRAIKSAEEATQIDPDMADAFMLLGALTADSDATAALRYYSAAADVDPSDPYPIHVRADFLRDAGRIEEAIEAYRSIMLVDRQYVAGNFNAGLLLMELDSLERARREFDLTLKNDPAHARAYFFRGLAAERIGDLAAARQDYENALALSPDLQLAREGLARLDG